MNILAFDTCLDKMYVGGKFDNNEKGAISQSIIIETTKEHYHSAFLISTIRDFLKSNNLSPNDVDVIATNVGPGSFTGIRACVTVARVFAQANDSKTVGVSSLEVLSRINPTAKKTLVALDARKEMAYVSIFDNKKQIFAPQTVLVSVLKEMLEKEDYYIVTDDKLEPILGGVSYQQCENDLGQFLVQIAAEKLAEGVDADWRKLHPLYIQPPPVTVKKPV